RTNRRGRSTSNWPTPHVRRYALSGPNFAADTRQGNARGAQANRSRQAEHTAMDQPCGCGFALGSLQGMHGPGFVMILDRWYQPVDNELIYLLEILRARSMWLSASYVMNDTTDAHLRFEPRKQDGYGARRP